jgi:DNA-directed RNA polymerase specialized sigma24 family protein
MRVSEKPRRSHPTGTRQEPAANTHTALPAHSTHHHDHMMASALAARPSLTLDDYVANVQREVVRLAGRVRLGFVADDLAQEIALEVLERPSIMHSYPNPQVYVRQRLRHAGIQFDRAQRVQRGEGARLFQGADGLRHPGRIVVSGNVSLVDGGGDLYSLVVDAGNELEVLLVDQLAAAGVLRQCLRGLTPTELHDVWMVDACGYTVLEVAELRGQRRETVSRRVNDARRRIQANRAQLEAELERLE